MISVAKGTSDRLNIWPCLLPTWHNWWNLMLPSKPGWFNVKVKLKRTLLFPLRKAAWSRVSGGLRTPRPSRGYIRSKGNATSVPKRWSCPGAASTRATASSLTSGRWDDPQTFIITRNTVSFYIARCCVFEYVLVWLSATTTPKYSSLFVNL